MTLTRFLLDTGPEGASATNANSGSSASSLGGGTTVYAAAAAAQGPFGIAITNVASSQTYRRWPFAAATKVGQVSFVYTHLTPGVTLDFAAIVNTNGNRRLSVRVTDTGILRLVDAGGATYNLVNSGVITAGTKVRVAFEFTGGSTTASTVTAQAYIQSTPGKWDSPVGSAVSTSTANLNTDDIIGFEFGVMTAVASVQTVRGDTFQLNDGAGSRIPDYSTATTTSTAYRWSGTAYVPLDAYRWNGTAYVALDRANP